MPLISFVKNQSARRSVIHLQHNRPTKLRDSVANANDVIESLSLIDWRDRQNCIQLGLQPIYQFIFSTTKTTRSSANWHHCNREQS